MLGVRAFFKSFRRRRRSSSSNSSSSNSSSSLPMIIHIRLKIPSLNALTPQSRTQPLLPSPTMSSPPSLLKLKIHHGDSTAVSLLPLSDMTIEAALEIAALEFPAQFSAAAASSDVLALYSFGTSGARFSEISSTPLLRALFLKQESARVYVLPPPLTFHIHFLCAAFCNLVLRYLFASSRMYALFQCCSLNYCDS